MSSWVWKGEWQSSPLNIADIQIPKSHSCQVPQIIPGLKDSLLQAEQEFAGNRKVTVDKKKGRIKGRETGTSPVSELRELKGTQNGISDWILEQEKDISGETGEIWMQSAA